MDKKVQILNLCLKKVHHAYQIHYPSASNSSPKVSSHLPKALLLVGARSPASAHSRDLRHHFNQHFLTRRRLTDFCFACFKPRDPNDQPKYSPFLVPLTGFIFSSHHSTMGFAMMHEPKRLRQVFKT